MNRVALTPDVAGKLGLKAGDTALVRASWGDIHPLYAAVVVGVFDESTLAALDAARESDPGAAAGRHVCGPEQVDKAGSHATGGIVGGPDQAWPDVKLPPLVPGPRRKMLVEVEVSVDFEKRLDNTWEVGTEIMADRWAWRWGSLAETLGDSGPTETEAEAFDRAAAEVRDRYWNGRCPLCEFRLSGTSKTVGRLIQHLVGDHLHGGE